MNKKQDVLNKMKEVYKDLEKLGYKVFLMYLNGSQNYNLDLNNNTYQSDVDMKAFVLPTVDDLYYGTKVSKTLDTPYGHVEVKDLRLFSELLSKMNSSYVELLFTDYFLAPAGNDPYRVFREDLLVERKMLLVKGMYGTLKEKENALEKPYAGLVEKLAKFGGYDPKQLHHLMRMELMLERLCNGWSYKDALKFDEGSFEKNLLMDVKVNGVGPVEVAREWAQKYVEKARFYADLLLEDVATPTSETIHKVEDLTHKLVMDYLK